MSDLALKVGDVQTFTIFACMCYVKIRNWLIYKGKVCIFGAGAISRIYINIRGNAQCVVIVVSPGAQ